MRFPPTNLTPYLPGQMGGTFSVTIRVTNNLSEHEPTAYDFYAGGSFNLYQVFSLKLSLRLFRSGGTVTYRPKSIHDRNTP